MKRLLPVAIVGLVAVSFAGAVVTDWLLDMWSTSVRVEGRYAERITPPVAAKTFPKDTYVCTPGAKNPWVGCTIQ